MGLIHNISSTLKTWVFKKKLLKFSDRFARDPQACFYCPEMCRFSCPTAEALRTNAVTPRAKMSLLHLEAQGYSVEQTTGSVAEQQWFLEQCTSCGRCTEFCVHEIDVGSNLRNARQALFEKSGKTASSQVDTEQLSSLRGKILFCEPNREKWWSEHRELLVRLGVTQVVAFNFETRRWQQGQMSDDEMSAIARALRGCSDFCAESPELAWFVAKALKEKGWNGKLTVVWQHLFENIVVQDFDPGVALHESGYLVRKLPHLGFSIPMYERGAMPFHSGWNAHDCGGESFYADAHGHHASVIASRYLKDLVEDGRVVKKIVCQNLSCVEHLKKYSDVKVEYWLDNIV